MQGFGAFMAPLTSGRVTIAVSAVYMAKVTSIWSSIFVPVCTYFFSNLMTWIDFFQQMSLAIAIRYSLTRRAFSITPNGAEVLLLDYPSHQRRLLPLLEKT